MYQAFGLEKCLKYVLLFNALLLGILATSLSGVLPDLTIFRGIPVSVMLTTGVLSLVGQSAIFPWICRLPLVWRVLPDVEGIYEMSISSNWSLIDARRKGDPVPTQSDIGPLLFKKTGTLTLKARLFTIAVHVEMDDRYMASDTIVASIKRETDQSCPVLTYVFRARITQPLTTDSSHHFGAGRIEIPHERTPRLLEGNYWTDRNWQNALNTAGRISLRRKRGR